MKASSVLWGGEGWREGNERGLCRTEKGVGRSRRRWQLANSPCKQAAEGERESCMPVPGLTESQAKDEKGRPTLHTYLARRRTFEDIFPSSPCLIFVWKGESIPLNPGEKENATLVVGRNSCTLRNAQCWGKICIDRFAELNYSSHSEECDSDFMKLAS